MTCEISDITVKIINNSVTAFLNGEEKMRLPDAVSAEDICGKLSIGALNDGGLPFNGMIKDIKIRTWCTE